MKSMKMMKIETTGKLKSARWLLSLVTALGLVLTLARPSAAQEPWYRLYEKGLAAIEEGNWDEAENLLSAAIEQGPEPGRSVRTYGVRFMDFVPGYYLAVAEYNRGNYERALEALDDTFGSRVIEEGDEEYGAATELFQRAQLALRARRGLGTETDRASNASPGGESGAELESRDVPGPASRGARAVARTVTPAYTRGRYVALAIGNAAYENFPSLSTPVEDARAVTELLEATYGFETHLIENAGRADIIDGIDELMRELSPDDSLLIFYAGHGVLDEESNEGYWLPVTAERDRRSEWLSNSEIRNILRRSPAKHVLVIADSCFSGTLTRAVRIGRAFETDLDRYYEKLASQKSRTALTSGGLEPVDDGGGGGHSIFASSLLRALENNEEPILEAELLHTQITRDVVLNSTGGQQPLYSDVRNTGHENGDFLFVRTTPHKD